MTGTLTNSFIHYHLSRPIQTVMASTLSIPDYSSDTWAPLLDLALQSGAQTAEVYATQTHSHVVTFEANQLKQVESIEQQGVALRLWIANRCGIAVAYGPFDPIALVKRAIALSQWGTPSRLSATSLSPASWLTSSPSLTVSDLVSTGHQTVDLIRACHPDVLCHGVWSMGSETVQLVNTSGLNCTFADHSVDGSIEAEWIRGDDFLYLDADWSHASRLHKPATLAPPHQLADSINQRLDWAATVVDLPQSGFYPVAWLPSAVDVILDPVVTALNARHVLQGTSPWGDRLGTTVISPLLTLSQDPHFGPFGMPFDDEGSACQPATFVENGVLQAFYGDRYRSQQLKSCTTGNGLCASLGSLPSPSLYHLLLSSARCSFQNVLNQLGRGLVVERLMGEGGDLSGDFSAQVEVGYWVEDGQIVGRVNGLAIAGNSYELLNTIAALGSAGSADTASLSNTWSGSYYTPILLTDGVSAIADTG